jgi:hypothetical protein
MRPTAIVLCLAMAGLGGCGDPHREAIRRQVANFEELADLLDQITDEPSMAVVEKKVSQRMAAFQRAAKQAGELGPPDPETARGYEEEFGPRLKAAFDRYLAGLRRIRTMPGGAEFVDRIGKKDSAKVP